MGWDIVIIAYTIYPWRPSLFYANLKSCPKVLGRHHPDSFYVWSQWPKSTKKHCNTPKLVSAGWLPDYSNLSVNPLDAVGRVPLGWRWRDESEGFLHSIPRQPTAAVSVHGRLGWRHESGQLLHGTGAWWFSILIQYGGLFFSHYKHLKFCGKMLTSCVWRQNWRTRLTFFKPIYIIFE
jgi:hypothetical protein